MKIIFACFLLLLLSPSAWGQTCTTATCTAASVAESDVLAALPSPSNTNPTVVVNIPSGSATWTTCLNYTVPSAVTNLSIIGAGNSTTGGGDLTNITDNVNHASCDYTVSITTGAPSTYFRWSGITLQNSSTISNNGVMTVWGTSQNVRIDHSHFLNLNQLELNINSQLYGVADHNIFDQADLGVRSLGNGWDGTTPGSGDAYGDGSWADTTGLGSGRYFFFENNVFNSVVGSGQPLPGNDCLTGGRFVMRFNTFNHGSALQTHPTGHDSTTGNDRGCRAWEIYQNTFNWTSGDSVNAEYNMFFMSSGTGVIWGNNATGFSSNFITMHSTRRGNGTYPQCGTPGAGCWGYCGSTPPSGQSSSGVTSPWDQNSSSATGYRCLDQPGSGQGQLLSGTFGVGGGKTNTSTGTAAWPNDALEPVYEWMDQWSHPSGWPGSFWLIQDTPSFTNNLDFYQWCDPTSPSGCTTFDGTQGVGSGTLASRPSTCTTGVAYWATDQGSWNSSGSGGQGQLYKCTATNTWTLSYQPYTYPHPLAAGGGVVATPTFSPVSGSYSSPQWVKISTTTPSAICYYTIDGSAPTTSSAIADHYLWITSTQTVKSICAASGLTNSAIGSAAYTITSQPTRFSLSLPNTSTSYAPFPQDNRPPAGSGTDLNSLCPTRGGCVWTTLGNWIAQSQANSSRTYWTIQKMPTWFTGLGSPENAPASDLTTSALCQAPIATTTDYACRVQEVAASLGEYLTGLSSPPASPQSCSSKLYAIEQTNEFNTNGSTYVGWAGTAAQLATEAYYWNKQMRLWCYDIVEMPGSVSGIDGGSSPISNHFDIAMAAVLAAWPQGQKPDAVSEHPYPNNQSQCAAFPTTNVSATSFGCTGGTGYIAVDNQINTMKSSTVLQQSSTVAWSGNLSVLADEGGFGEIKQACGSTSCSNTDAATIAFKTAWVSEAMISLRQQGAAAVLFYLGYDPTGTPCQSTDWGCYRWTAASTDSPWYPGYSQTNSWMAATTAISAPVTTAVTGGNATTYNATVSGAAAQYAWCDASYPATCSMATSFNHYQDINSVAHVVSGGIVPLSQTPVMLYNSPATPNPLTVIIIN